MSRIKAVSVSEFADYLRGWDSPVFCADDSLPLLGAMPDRYGYIVSGELLAPYAFDSQRFGVTTRVGGIYALRHDPKDAKPLNRYDYALVPSIRFGDQVWLDGPYRHPTEHWADHDDVGALLRACVL
jgi:hypothetical protein